MELLTRSLLCLLAATLIVLAICCLAGWIQSLFDEKPHELDVEFAADFDALQEERARAEAVQRREADHQVARAKFGGPLRDGHEL